MAHSLYLSKLSPQQREELIKRLWECQKGKCFISGKEIDLNLHKNAIDIDHIIPLVNKGKDDESNFALTFSSANRAKQATDLNLARTNWSYKELADYLQKEENRNPNLNDILKKFEGASFNLNYLIKDNKIKFSFPEIEKNEIFEVPIYYDVKGDVEYFFALIPIQYIFHDDEINPRTIGSNISKLLAEFYKGNPQLHVSLGYLETNDNNNSPIKLFDGQHKAAAQILLGTREIPVRIFINPDKEKIKLTNFNAGTSLKQVAFDKSVQRHLGSALYQDRVERYQKQSDRSLDDFSFSEKTLINFYKGEARELKRYILDAVKDGITHSEENKLREYIDRGGRAKEKPLSYASVEKTFYSFFISSDPLDTSLDFKLEEGLNPRDLEKKQIIRLMNIIADNILIGKYDLEVGTNRIENRIQQGDETLDWNHVAAFRMMKEEILYAWLSYINDIVSMYYANMGKRVANRHDFFQEAFPEQLWNNIENFIINLAELPLWKNKELSSTIFGGKQNYSFWKNIFEKGQSINGEKILAKPLEIKEMILPVSQD